MKKTSVLTATALFALLVLAPADEKSKPPRITKANLTEMEILVEQGADPNKPIYYSRMLLEGETEPPDSLGSYFPLDAAIDTHQRTLVKRILALGAKPRGNELADVAFKSHGSTSVEIARMLLKAGVDPNDPDHRFYGPALHAAASRGNMGLVELLLAQPKIEVDLRDVDGRTALMPAATGGHLNVVEALLEAGADPSLKNRRGQTAADEARGEIENRARVISRLQSTVQSRWTGRWNVAYSNGIEQVHELHKNHTATALAEVFEYFVKGQITFEGESLSIKYSDKHYEKWTPVGDHMVVEHWDPVSQPGKAVKVIGIGARSAQKVSIPTEKEPGIDLPVGEWTIRFANGVVEACKIRKDGGASVSEPLRSSPGRAKVKGDSVVIAFDDDRIERFRPVGDRLVVEHWHPISEMETGKPAVGIAERTPLTR